MCVHVRACEQRLYMCVCPVAAVCVWGGGVGGGRLNAMKIG